jgi:23S rRNA (cytidine1920-2'-O)/16S rRNA (cytidine1409-2'-O)-methyltransferase
VLEKTNARHLSRDLIPEPAGALVCDASFIGLQIVLPAAMDLCAPGAFAVALIKPQFEAGPEHVGKGGVVRDPAIHEAVCARIATWWSALPNWHVQDITPSPITGPEGNIEFLIGALKTP